MKKTLLYLIIILCFVSCTEKTTFQGFFYDDFDAVPPDPNAPCADPLTIVKQNPGKQYHTKYAYYVYRGTVISEVSREEGVVQEAWMRPYYSTTFKIHLTYNYTAGEEMDLYRDGFRRGTDEYQLYGDVIPNIGDELLIVETNIDDFSILNHYRIIEWNGDEYCLPINIVTETVFEGGITPPDEYKYTYTTEHDPEILAYLKKNNIANPKVSEIFQLDVLVPQLIAREDARNEAILSGTFVYDRSNTWGMAEVQVIFPYDYTKGYEE